MNKISGLKSKEKSGSLLTGISQKKGVSPVVATVLLVVIVIVIGLIIFLWFRSFTDEAITKFEGTNIELVCDDVEFSVNYNSATGSLSISNTGNVPIYDINLKITEGRSRSTESLEDISEIWPSEGLREADSFSDNLENVIGNADEVLATPVLIGTTDGERKTHDCDDRHGEEVLV